MHILVEHHLFEYAAVTDIMKSLLPPKTQEAALYVEKKTNDEHLNVPLYIIRPQDLSNSESIAI